MLTAAATAAFTILPSHQTLIPPNTQLNLFGSKNKDSQQQGGQPGMMDQLAMFKKAQEIGENVNTVMSYIIKNYILDNLSS